MKTIYLCGPMADCDDRQATWWRNTVKMRLGKMYVILDPMVRDFRKNYDREEHERLIVEGDKHDIGISDIVLAYPWKSSAGTSMEIIHAWDLRKQVLVIADRDMQGKTRRLSPWITYHSHEVFSTLDAAIDYLLRLAPNRPKLKPIKRPCSACSAGDTEGLYHNHDDVREVQIDENPGDCTQ